MAADDKKTKTEPAPKKEAAAKPPSTADAAPAKAEGTSDATPAKTAGGETSANYSRGEGQKPVTKAYKDNWNVIFGRKKKKR